MNPDNQSVKSTFNHYCPAILLFAFTCILYSNTLLNNYALDDAITITLNDYTKKGVHGLKSIFSEDSFTGFFGQKKDLVPGGRYRPLSIATFAIEYQFFGENPTINHLINVLLYAFTVVLLYILISRLFNELFKPWFMQLGFIAALLFAVHPIHTEVVANIKGRDEILALLFSLFTLMGYLRLLETKKYILLIPVFLSFFLALLSKENAAVFLAIVPLTAWFFRNNSLKSIITGLYPMLVAALLYFIIRQTVTGTGQAVSQELMNNPFLYATSNQRLATIIYVLGRYFKLLVFPHPQTYDYYPYHIALQNFEDFWVILPGLGYLLMLVLIGLLYPQKNPLAYALLFYIVALIPFSNLLVNIGTFMNERFLYFPSVGFVILVAILLKSIFVKFTQKNQIYLYLILVPIVILFSIKTYTRNKVWKNDYTLFTTDVLTSYNSAKSNCTAGGALIEKAKSEKNPTVKKALLDQSVYYLQRSVKIHPNYADALLLLGNAYYDRDKNIDSTYYYYKKILENNPWNENVYNNINLILNKTENIDKQILIYKELALFNPNRWEAFYKLGNIYGKVKQEIDSSLYYLNKAYTLNPSGIQINKDLGVAYGINGDFENSLNFLIQAMKLDPSDAQNVINIGVTYQRMGNIAEAKKYFDEAAKIKTSEN